MFEDGKHDGVCDIILRCLALWSLKGFGDSYLHITMIFLNLKGGVFGGTSF